MILSIKNGKKTPIFSENLKKWCFWYEKWVEVHIPISYNQSTKIYNQGDYL
jgi:hypothetical protein